MTPEIFSYDGAINFMAEKNFMSDLQAGETYRLKDYYKRLGLHNLQQLRAAYPLEKNKNAGH
jgi:hypothetical protein